MLLNYLKEVPDYRRAQGQRYQLHEILFVSILAILSGADSYRDITRFVKSRLKQLKKWFEITLKRAPSKSNLRKIFCGVDKTAVEKVFRNYSDYLSKGIMKRQRNMNLPLMVKY